MLEKQKKKLEALCFHVYHARFRVSVRRHC